MHISLIQHDKIVDQITIPEKIVKALSKTELDEFVQSLDALLINNDVYSEECELATTEDV